MKCTITIFLFLVQKAALEDIVCSHKYTVAICVGKIIKEGDKINYDNTSYALECKSCEIKNIYIGLFETTSSLKKLNMASSSIETVTPGVFDNLTDLEYLSLEHNKIRKLTPGTFNTLTNLQRLVLSFNSLESIEDGLFQNLTKLEDLQFCCNLLTALDATSFKGLVNLKHADLGDNHISAIAANTFSILHRLQELYLHSNRLQTSDEKGENSKVEVDAFVGLPYLIRLSLNNNFFTALPGGLFRHLNTLPALDLSSNRLTRLANDSLEGLNLLTDLVIANNRLDSLNVYAFAPLKHLQLLDFSNNFIGDVNTSELLLELPNLKMATFNGNSFSSCEGLSEMVKTFEKNNVTVARGDHVGLNVGGIACGGDIHVGNFEEVEEILISRANRRQDAQLKVPIALMTASFALMVTISLIIIIAAVAVLKMYFQTRGQKSVHYNNSDADSAIVQLI